ncbi:MAG: hypothetical protein IT200_14705 [Thermoleophilia bacterium]|nr:hypothetical protein [Thermoleophilia bacterium]
MRASSSSIATAARDITRFGARVPDEAPPWVTNPTGSSAHRSVVDAPWSSATPVNRRANGRPARGAWSRR